MSVYIRYSLGVATALLLVGCIFGGLSAQAQEAVVVVETNNLLTGKVTDTSKVPKPIVGRAIRLVAADSSLAGLGITDANGNYKITGFKAGTYSVVVPDEIEIVKKKQVLKSPTKITVGADNGVTQTVDAKVKLPKTVPPVSVKIIDPNNPTSAISSATVQYKTLVGTKAKPATAISPASLSKLKPGCYSFSTNKLVGYYLNEAQKSIATCFDQYGPTGRGEGYQITFFQTKLNETRCDKVAQTDLDDFWFCGKKARAAATNATDPYQLVWKRVISKVTELRKNNGPADAPNQIAMTSEQQVGLDTTFINLSSFKPDANATCPTRRQSGGTTEGIPNPDKTESILFPETTSYIPINSINKQLQPYFQRHLDVQTGYLYGFIRDWRMGGCKGFASKDSATTINQLYQTLRTNYPKELDDALNLNRYLGAGANGMYPHPLYADDPAKVYAATFAIGTVLKAEFDENLKGLFNNQDSTPYKSGAVDALKNYVTQVTKKL